MNIAGIVSEYNPFHRGHEYHIAETRRHLGEDCGIIAVMSGNVVQRGDFPILDKHARAEAALADARGEGADLVLELPCCWSLASAEGFAEGAVGLLDALGVVTHLSFGSETGSLEPLMQVADILLSEQYDVALRSQLQTGVSYAAARQRAVESILGDTKEMVSPNNILGIEYLKALMRRESTIEPLAVLRTGAGHDDAAAGRSFPSAKQLRDMLLAGQVPDESLMPSRALEVLNRELNQGRAPVSLESCQRAVLARLRCLEEQDFEQSDSSREGLWRRFMDAARTENSMEDIVTATKTKRYARSRIRRMLMRTYLGLPANLPARVPYVRPLAFNARGRKILRMISARSELPLLVKPAQARRLPPEVCQLFLCEARVTDLFSLAMPDISQVPGSSEWRNGVYLGD